MNIKSRDGKLRYDLEDPTARAELVAAIQYGAARYEENNWRENAADALPLYYSAIERHFAAIFRGEVYDSDSGLPHIAHIQASAHFICALSSFTPLSERLPEALRRAADFKRARAARVYER